MKYAPDWEVEGRDWPNRETSRFVVAGNLRWHVQIMGQGPALLLLHGTGAATHSWRDLAPLLSAHYTIIAPDLPGHGFTDLESRRNQTPTCMAERLTALLSVLDVRPVALIGHSAGAAIAVRMALDGGVEPQSIISLNGALTPFDGLNGVIYPALAKLLFLNPVAEAVMAWRAANPAAVARIIAGTGSYLDPRGLDLYVRLMRCQRHVGAALSMMANWDLRPLQSDAARLDAHLVLIAAQGDRAVPPSVAHDFRRRVKKSTVLELPGLGHLAHEEAPDQLAKAILAHVQARESLHLDIGRS
jgi:magnesium chelatase accessory protein